ncbi:MAG: hypothetical protein ACRD43_08960, partial [Pyrinomonadaceae bacterium]
MSIKTVTIKTHKEWSAYEIRIGAGTLSSVGSAIRENIGPAGKRVAIVSNSKVFDLYGDSVVANLKRA